MARMFVQFVARLGGCFGRRRTVAELVVESLDDVAQRIQPRLGRRSELSSPVQHASIAPSLTTNRQAIEHLAMELPLGHESVHQRDEPGVVCRL